MSVKKTKKQTHLTAQVLSWKSCEVSTWADKDHFSPLFSSVIEQDQLVMGCWWFQFQIPRSIYLKTLRKISMFRNNGRTDSG